jgi:hypothetical protein
MVNAARALPSPSTIEPRPLLGEPLLARLVVGHCALHATPELVAVVLNVDVGQLVDDDVVDDAGRL